MMLLRYSVFYGAPVTNEEWAAYKEWVRRQETAPECKMAQMEVSPTDCHCETCVGRPGCPKEHRRRP